MAHSDQNSHSLGWAYSRKLVAHLYGYVWQTSRSKQIVVCVLAMIIAPLPMVYLELQRRIVDDALPQSDLKLLIILAAAYFVVICVKSALKYALNMVKGTVVETVARDIRLRIMKTVMKLRGREVHNAEEIDAGSLVSMLSAETEDMSGFAGDAFAVPLLSVGTILYVVGYLVWVQPAIAVVAVIVYLPQALIVPAAQPTINRFARLRIRLTRHLGHLAVRGESRRSRVGSQFPGHSLLDRLYRVRIWIYLRKFFLSELGNFLANLGTLIVLAVGGYLVIIGKTQVGTLIVFISGLQKIADPWDEIVNFYRAVSNTSVMYAMIRDKLKATPLGVPASASAKTAARRPPRKGKTNR